VGLRDKDFIFLFLPAFQVYPLRGGYARETLRAEHGHPEDSLPAGRRQQGRRSVFRHLVFHNRRLFLLILLFLCSLYSCKPLQSLLSQCEGSCPFTRGLGDVGLRKGDRLQECPDAKSPRLGRWWLPWSCATQCHGIVPRRGSR